MADLYKTRPDVQCVVHVHPLTVVLFTICNKPLLPLYGAYDPSGQRTVRMGDEERVGIAPEDPNTPSRPHGTKRDARSTPYSVPQLRRTLATGRSGRGKERHRLLHRP